MKVLIIGAGVIGLTCALRLADEGASVTVADRRFAGAGASSTNAGWIVPSMAAPIPSPGIVAQAVRWTLAPGGPFYVRPSLRPDFIRFLVAMARNCSSAHYNAGLRALAGLSANAQQQFHDLIAADPDVDFHSGGLIQLYLSEKRWQSSRASLRQVQELTGMEYQVLDKRATQDKIPGVSASVAGALEIPGESHLDPRTLIARLVRRCETRGVSVLSNASVSLTGNPAGVTAHLNGDDVRFDNYVVAAGVWTNQVISGLRWRLPLESGKGYGYDLAAHPQLGETALYLAEARLALSPLRSGLRVSGTMALSGLDERVHQTRARHMLDSGRAYFDFWDTQEPGPAWSGLRPLTPDGLPVIGPLPGSPNVVIATGHAMLGVTLAPATANLVGQFVQGVPNVKGAEAFQATRFKPS